MTMYRTVIVIFLLGGLLSACSFATRLAYNNLDWLAQNWIEDYVDLNDEQQARFDDIFEQWWRWHRQSQLPLYAEFLREQAHALEAAHEPPPVEPALAQLQDFYLAALEHSFTPVSDWLAQLNEDQVDALLDTLQAKSSELREDQTPADPVQNREKEARKLARRLLGRLSDEQEQRIRDWAQGPGSNSEQWLSNDQRWQEGFAQALRQRQTGDFEAMLRRLLLDPGSFWTQAHREQVEAEQIAQLQMMQDLLRMASPRQRRHLQKRLINWARLCEKLAEQTP